MMPKAFSLGKKERLKSRKAIDELFAHGKSFSVFPIRVSYMFFPALPTEEEPLKIGVTASSKNFKKAVDRNRIKRLLRETFRLQKTELSGVLKEKGLRANIFFLFVDKQLPVYNDLFKAMAKCLELLQKKAASHERSI